MPGIVLLAAAVAVNYLRQRRGRSTICSTARRALPRPLSASALLAGSAALVVHVWRGYPSRGIDIAVTNPTSVAKTTANASAFTP